jgi:hypothetical protein
MRAPFKALHGEILEKLVERTTRCTRVVEQALPDGSGDVRHLPVLHRRASM